MDQWLLQRIELSVRGGVNRDEMLFLYEQAKFAKSPIVEIGTAQGRSAIILAMGSRDGNNAPVYTIDPQVEFAGPLGGGFVPADRAEAFSNFLRFGVAEVIRVINLPSTQAAVCWSEKIDLLWIDGNHRIEGVSADYSAWSPHVSETGVIVFDDTHVPNLGPDIVANGVPSDGYSEIPCVGKMRAFKKEAQPSSFFRRSFKSAIRAS